MLTWAMIFMMKYPNVNPPVLLFLVSMGSHVAIFYYIALAFGAKL